VSFRSFRTNLPGHQIVLIELLISPSFAGRQCMPHDLTFDARGMVDDECGEEDLRAAIEAKSLNCAHSCWVGSEGAKQAAKLLTAVAVKCVRGAAKRCTPAEVLAELEAAARIAGVSQAAVDQSSQ
jgi:hypothetical protein